MAKQKEVGADTGTPKDKRKSTTTTGLSKSSVKQNTKPTGVKYTPEQVTDLFERIVESINDNGTSLTKACAAVKVSKRTFYEWLEDKTPAIEFRNTYGERINFDGTIGRWRQNQYARACEGRADAIFDEIFDIVDDGRNDTYTIEAEDGTGIEKTDYDVIARSKLRYEARKWAAGKLNPKKYGDKVEQMIVGDEARPVVISLGGGVKPE